MFKNKIIRYSTLAMLIAVLAYFVTETFTEPSEVPGIEASESLNPETYANLLRMDRKDTRQWFLTAEDSPITDKASFTGPEYYDIDLKYRVVARVEPYKGEDKIFEVAYTDGTRESYERFAYLHFDLDGKPQKLLLLKEDGALSLMFRDRTSGVTSYGGGRYLDFASSDVRSGYLVVDFNKAYNPYCAYNPGYACPLPPPENSLTESVPAGERFTAEK